jgi:inorganic pyrophosphatase
LPPHLLQEVHRFFEDYKKLEGKDVVVHEFQSKEVAHKIIQDALALYDKTFKPKLGPLMENLVIPETTSRE